MRFFCLGITIIACSLSFLVGAQEPSNSQSVATFKDLLEGEAGGPVGSTDDADLRKLVGRVLTLRLQQRVGLTDEQTDALSLRFGAFKEHFTAMKFQREGDRERLRQCLNVGLDEDEIRVKLEALLKLEEEIAELLHLTIEAAKEDLTVAQSAKLYLFVGEFEAFMRDLVYRAQYRSLHGAEPPRESESGPTASGESSIDALKTVVRNEPGSTSLPERADSDMVALFDGLLMARLSKELGLGPAETVALFHRVGTYKDQLHELKWQIGAARFDLNETVETDAAPEVVAKKLEDLLLQEEAAADLIRSMVTEAQKDVTLRQSAQLYLFVGDFEEYVGRLLERAERSG